MNRLHARSVAQAAMLAARLVLGVIFVLGMVPWALPGSPPQTVEAAPPTDLFFSEYVEGSYNNKALEIYNGTGAAINLATGNYVVASYHNGGTTVTAQVALTGSVSANDVYVLAHGSASFASAAYVDQTTSTTLGWFNGDDAVILWKGGVGGTILDVIGQVGFDPGFQWGSGLASTADNTLRRKITICAGDTNPDDAFDPSVEWDGYADNTFDGLGAHTASCGTGDTAPSVSSTVPADGATDVALDASVTVTFSEAVVVSGDWFLMSCDVSGNRAPGLGNVTVTQSGTSFTIDPTADFQYGDDCTVTVYAGQVADVDTDDPPDNMAANHVFGFAAPLVDPCDVAFTPTYAIQGSGASTPLSTFPANEDVHTEGIVTASFQDTTNGRSGFFIQDATGDGDDATSDGLFVYDNGFGVAVSVGDEVHVIGDVTEYYGLTELSVKTYDSDHQIYLCGTGSAGSTTVNLPIPDDGTARDAFWEPYEGMLITIPQTLTVTEHYNLGRYGQVLLSTGGRLQQFTHISAPDVAGYTDHLEDNGRRRIMLDDHSGRQNPDPVIHPDPELTASNTLRGGDTVSGLTGVLFYTFNEWVIDPIAPVPFVHANPRPLEAPDVGGTITVASFNLLNFFSTVDTSTPICGPAANLECRGADSAEELQRQIDKTVAALVKLDADIVGLMEVENNATDAPLTLLVDSLNAVVGAGTYDYIATGPIGGDAIRVALIYKPGTVALVGDFAVLDSVAPFNTNTRPPLVQTFEEIATEGLFTVVVNHFKSKGCDGATGLNLDQGDGQSCYNADRVLAANALATWLATDPTDSDDPDVLIIGDLNSYALEDPIVALEGEGYTDLLKDALGTTAYSYVFNGEWGYLDYALANADLLPQVTGAGTYPINSDEPRVLDYNVEFKSVEQIVDFFAPDEFRMSDHDPVVVGLSAEPTPEEPDGGEPAGAPGIGYFDPALSKVGTLPAGGIGLPGERLTWTITVTNEGTATGADIVITDTLRPELRIDSVEMDRGSFTIDGQTVTFTIPWLDPGESVEMRINTTVISSPLGGAFTNEVSLTGLAPNGDVATARAVGTVLAADMLPATGYPPAEDAASSWLLSSWWWVALAGGLALVAGVWALRRRSR
ncbi:MAG: ExeM/NucH family extracellular endonuclease [Chloroflexota bacterium]